MRQQAAVCLSPAFSCQPLPSLVSANILELQCELSPPIRPTLCLPPAPIFNDSQIIVIIFFIVIPSRLHIEEEIQSPGFHAESSAIQSMFRYVFTNSHSFVRPTGRLLLPWRRKHLKQGSSACWLHSHTIVNRLHGIDFRKTGSRENTNPPFIPNCSSCSFYYFRRNNQNAMLLWWQLFL